MKNVVYVAFVYINNIVHGKLIMTKSIHKIKLTSLKW